MKNGFNRHPTPDTRYPLRFLRLLAWIAVIGLLAAPRAKAEERLPWLHAEGLRIVDEAGRPVVLRGFNLGGAFTIQWLREFRFDQVKGIPMEPLGWSCLLKR